MRVAVPVRAAPHRVSPDPETAGVATHRWLANPDDLVALEAARRVVESTGSDGAGDTDGVESGGAEGMGSSAVAGGDDSDGSGSSGAGTTDSDRTEGTASSPDRDAERGEDAVIAIGIGDERAETAIETALRTGADEALHVEYDPIEEPVGDTYATVLARAVEHVGATVACVGERGPTLGAEVPAIAGDRLGWRTAAAVTAIGPEEVSAEVEGSDERSGSTDRGKRLVVERRLGPGRREVVAIQPPAVLGIDSGFGNPPRGSLPDVLAAQRTPIETRGLSAIAPGESRFSMSVGSTTVRDLTADQRIGRGTPPREDSVEGRILRMMGRRGDGEGGGGEIVTAPPEEAADRVVEYLEANDLL